MAKTRPRPPVASRHPVTVVRHGETIEDPYHWLRDADWQRVMRDPSALGPEIRKHLEAENAYAEAVLAPVAKLRKALVKEMRARLNPDESTVPARDGDWAYYRRFRRGGQYPVFCRRAAPDGDERILLDGDHEAKGQSFFRVRSCLHSPDHRWIAYAADRNGSEIYGIRFRDAATGEELSETLGDAHGDVAWAADSGTLFYTVLDDNHRPSRVYRHALGTDPASDALVYEETDPGFFVQVETTQSGRYVMIHAHGHAVTSDTRLIDAADPTAAPVLIAPRADGVEYGIEDNGDRLLILTNADGAEDYKIVEAPIAAPRRDNWRDVVTHRSGCLIRHMVVYRDWLIRLEREDGLPRIVARRLADGQEHTIAFDEEAYDLGVLPGYEYDTANLRFVYSSPTTPDQTFDYDLATRGRVLRKTQEVPSGHNPADYVCRRLMAPSHDGELVPVTVLHRRDTPVDGSAPLLLYGYGSYGHAIPAVFSTNRLSLVDRGFVYAIAHIRGGMERGFRWYRDGKMKSKLNTFRDFIAAAEHVIGADYTRAGRIVGHGGSAGGMLMGAVANMRPDLFAAIIAEVPFVDVINTMCDETLPLTPPEWVEWGNPIRDPEAFRTMLSYSPYDNVTAQDYPMILATAGLTDPRVTYWEPAKWVARLRERSTSGKPIVLHTNMEAGHGGSAGRYDRLGEVALSYAFALMAVGKV